MKNLFSTENRLATIKNFAKIMDGKVDNDVIDNIKEKLLNLSVDSYAGTASINSSVFYTTLTVSLNVGKTFKGSAWGIESWTFGDNTYSGGLLTSDFDALITKGNNFVIGNISAGISIVFLNSSLKPMGYFEGLGDLAIGGAKGSGSWW
ncbi:VapA/VapB family virulence-associated protein [Xenorhabdus sp. DI]|uniref:VapA/VapB family virulence-associated protein n=1 Tax=Xenorhabdus doucetiae TaxID=351671 RepID=UPI0019B4E753|nr:MULTISPECIES: VapA/VapB family virulence-associated protein [unclassified Xenorhabdus]MBD2784033.1 VapA/VapB family virulence-associated protein [Xenorhabdus sp. 3]MBD2787842.1 VapA/VapB family virulence-associated protein [Xenorhabdus sp. DI]